MRIRSLMIFLLLFNPSPDVVAYPLNQAIHKVIKKYGKKADGKLKHAFDQVNMAYPPKEISLITIKDEQKVELWARDGCETWVHIKNYPLTAFSGKSGPKLKQYDLQIPEGIYKLVSLNPYSKWHLSMMINYPNEFDQIKGKQDQRRRLGNNIFIHGKASSAGCLSVGDKAIEELFVLTQRVGLDNTQLIIAPNDLRRKKPITLFGQQPAWLPELYKQISQALKPFREQIV